jgi:hypothetical protein
MNRPGVFVIGSRSVGADAAGTVGGRAALGGICFLCSQEQKQPMMKRDIPCLLCERWHLRIIRQGQGMRTVRSQRSSGADGIGCPCARSTRMPVDEPMTVSCSYIPVAGAASPGDLPAGAPLDRPAPCCARRGHDDTLGKVRTYLDPLTSSIGPAQAGADGRPGTACLKVRLYVGGEATAMGYFIIQEFAPIPAC